MSVGSVCHAAEGQGRPCAACWTHCAVVSNECSSVAGKMSIWIGARSACLEAAPIGSGVRAAGMAGVVAAASAAALEIGVESAVATLSEDDDSASGESSRGSPSAPSAATTRTSTRTSWRNSRGDKNRARLAGTCPRGRSADEGTLEPAAVASTGVSASADAEQLLPAQSMSRRMACGSRGLDGSR